MFCVRGLRYFMMAQIITPQRALFPLPPPPSIGALLSPFRQIIAPLCLVLPRKPTLLSPAVALSAFFLQWVWLLAGWVWAYSPSNCEYEAPFLYSGTLWTVIVYSIAVPMETLWYIRIYIAVWKSSKHGCDCPCWATKGYTRAAAADTHC